MAERTPDPDSPANPRAPRLSGGTYVVLICLVAAMGGLLFGYDWVVIGGAKPFFETYFDLGDENLRGWANSCALLGCLLGSLISGGLSDRFGRKRLLLAAAVLFAVSSLLTGWSYSFPAFVTWRILGGVAIGMASNLSPMYIAEVSPSQWRGRLVALNQLTIVIGILSAQIVNFTIADPVPTADQLRLLASTDQQVKAVHGEGFDVAAARAKAERITNPSALADLKAKFPGLAVLKPQSEDAKKAKQAEDDRLMDAYILPTWNGQYGWRWMFTAVAVPAVFFFLFGLVVPESPRWLVKNNQSDRARRVLARIGGQAHAQAELRDIRDTLAAEDVGRVRFADLLGPGMSKVLFIGCALAVLSQWSGINVIFNYAEEIFGQAGYSVSDVLFNIVITGTINLVFTFVAIGTVDRLGRRALVLVGCAGIAVCHTLIGLAYAFDLTGAFVLVLTLAAIASYAMSLAPITWVLISEIFPNRIRGAAISVAVSALWIACFLLTYTFPRLNKSLGPACTFWTYAAICAAGCVFVWLLVPETKGKTLEEIEQQWAPRDTLTS